MKQGLSDKVRYLARYKHQWSLFVVSGVILLGILKAFWKPSEPIAVPVNKLVEVQVVTTRPFQQTIRLLGTIHPQHTSVLSAKSAGVLDALVATGQRVTKGTLIAQIENPDVEKKLRLSLKTQQLAKTSLERYQPFLAKGVVSAKEIDEKKQTLINAQKDLSTARIAFDNLRFYAPFDGIVGAYKKREGAQVALGDPVVVLYDPDSLVVDFDIPCSHLAAVQPGQPVEVLKKRYRLSHVQNMIDEETHMCPADVDIQCASCLMGSSVYVDLIIMEKKKALVIPFQALFLKNSQPFVYTVEKGKIALVPVKTGVQQEKSIEILQGLTDGQAIVVKGQERLYPGLAVDVLLQDNRLR